MKFLVSNRESTAKIYGHIYQFKPVNSSFADLADILVMDSGTASELLRRHNDILAEASFDTNDIDGFPKKLNDLNQIPTGSKIVILRSGGIGDHIMFMPALKGLRKNLSHSNIELWLAVQEDMFPLFKGQPFIDKLFPLPLPMNSFIEADYYVDFSDSIQESDFNAEHPVDYYISALGLTPTKGNEKIVLLNLNGHMSRLITHLLNVIKEEYRGRPIILMQWLASVNIRSFPPESLSALTQQYGEFIFLSAHYHTQVERTARDIKKAGMNIIDISCHIRNLSDFITVVSMSDGVISTDSSAYHIAAAYEKPALALFGAIPSELRTSYYPHVISIDSDYTGKTCQSPCYLHKGACPEANHLGTFYSPCLISISEEEIYHNFKKLVDRYLS